MQRKRLASRLVSFILILCLAGGLPSVTAEDDVLFFETFSADALSSAWGNYNNDSTKGTLSLDTSLHALMYQQNQTGNQTGPQITFKASEVASWAGRNITISWKAYTDASSIYMRVNYNSDGESAFYNPSSDMGENFTPGEWHQYSIELPFSAEMAKREFILIFKVYVGADGVESTYLLDDIQITAGPAIPEITTDALPNAVNTVPYEQTLKSNGSPPIIWSVTSGSLPDGLSFSETGIISGTPIISDEKTFVFTVEAKNSLGTDTKELSIAAMKEDSTFSPAQTSGKDIGNSNPLFTQRFGADPWGMEYGGRLYIYMTNDNFKLDGDGKILTNDYQNIQHINVISSDDMVNWTDHGSIPAAGSGGVAPWAPASWAPAVIWKNIDGKDKFFLYYTPGGSGVVVLIADSPVGPWTDPLGKRLVDGSTPNCSGSAVPWCFDPAVFIDDKDGKAYLYFGGGIGGLDAADPRSARVVQLGDDMISIVGTPVEIAPPYLFEDSGIHKYNGKYYYSYCSNFNSPGYQEGIRPGNGQIAYMVSDNPMGPFTYVDILFKSQSDFGFGGGNNHHAVFQFMDEWYLTYHGRLVTKSMGLSDGLNYRSTHIDKVTIFDDGTIQQVTGTKEGIAQLKPFDPSQRVEAETIAWCGGIGTMMEDPTQQTTANLFVTGIKNGSWISVAQAITDNLSSFTVRAAGKRGGTIELRTGSPDPTDPASSLAASVNIAPGDGTVWTTETAALLSDLSGTQDLFLVFKGSINNVELFDFDWWQLSSETPSQIENTIPPPEDDSLPTPPDLEDSAETQPNGEEKNGGLPWPLIALAAAGAAVIAGVILIKAKKK